MSEDLIAGTTDSEVTADNPNSDGKETDSSKPDTANETLSEEKIEIGTGEKPVIRKNTSKTKPDTTKKAKGKSDSSTIVPDGDNNETDLPGDVMTLEEVDETTSVSKAVRVALINEEKQKSKHAFIYLGPNLPGGILFNGSVYKELPEHLAGVFEKIPEIKGLFVEVCAAPKFKRELKRMGSEEARLYQNVVMLIREGALKDGRV